MPVIPSPIDIFMALLLIWFFFLMVACIGLTLTALQREGGTSMPAALLALPSMREEEFMAYPYDGYDYEDEESFDDLDEADDYSTGGLEDWQ